MALPPLPDIEETLWGSTHPGEKLGQDEGGDQRQHEAGSVGLPRIEVLLDLLGGGLHEFEPPLAEQLSIPEEADNHGNDSGHQHRE